MATLNEIAYNIAEASGVNPLPEVIERIKMNVRYYRALIFRRDQQRNLFIPSQMKQILRCIKTVQKDSAECFGIDLPCNLFRTEDKIPAPIRLDTRASFTYVGTIDHSKPYSEMGVEDLGYVHHVRWSNNMPRYFYHDGYIYLVNAAPVKINVEGVFEDPEDVEGFIDCEGNPAYNEDMDYPISEDLIQMVTQSIMAGEFRNRLINDNTVNINE